MNTASAEKGPGVGRLSTERKIAQVLMPFISSGEDAAAIRRFADRHGIGGVFVMSGTRESITGCLRDLQAAADIPIVVSADLEKGVPRRISEGMTALPDLLALSATGDEELAYEYGRITALEGRALGIHWTFAPVADVQKNPRNPITLNRCLGDDEERISRLLPPLIRGMQDHGLAACAKHFPGDGHDCRDQHITTTVNPLAMEEWRAISARPFVAAIGAGVHSIMPGHIALPAWDPAKNRFGIHTPATLSRRITTDLLRGELGFDGVVVSDAQGMGGITGVLPDRDRIIASFNAGCDVLLFPDLERDAAFLREAVEAGRVTMARLDEAVSRILRLKEKLGLLDRKTLFHANPSPQQLAANGAIGRTICRRALYPARAAEGLLPLKLAAGARVLTVTLGWNFCDLSALDRELEARGCRVTHLHNPDSPAFFYTARDYDLTCVNFGFTPEWASNVNGCPGVHNRIFMDSFFNSPECPTLFTSFGNPFHLHELPQLPNLLNAHADGVESQKAVVDYWFGELDISGNQSPVRCRP